MAVVASVIVSKAEVMNGTPCFRGHPLAGFLEDFPTVSRAMAVQALEEAKASLIARIA